MGYDNRTVTVSADDVMTLSEVAEELKQHFGFAKCGALDKECVITFETEDGRKGYVDLGGWAHALDESLPEDERFDGSTERMYEFEVDWAGVLDFKNVIWADDADGNSVLVHD